MASEPTKKIHKKCKTASCQGELRARGFCVSCYYRNLRQGKIKAGDVTRKWKHRLTHIDLEQRSAICQKCGPVKIRSRGNGNYRCATDADERSRLYKQAYRASKKAMLVDHCEICNTKENLCWDHCHIEQQFRGTLCDTCNKGLGMFKDNPILLKKAAKYVTDRKKDKSGSL